MIITTRISTPIGEITAGATEKGVCLLSFSDMDSLKAELAYQESETGRSSEGNVNDTLKTLEKELDEYFSGRRKEFSVRLDLHGSDFQKKVWQELIKIPYGTTRSYLEQAEALDKASSVRAVANANGRNRIAIIIPCHRVIGSDGSLTGYAGGLDRKRWLLEHEKKNSGQSFDQLLF